MDFKYRWKNGTPPNRDAAAHSDTLLDESQFNNPHDQQLAEEMARKHLNVPLQTVDETTPVLPQTDPTAEEEEF
ncbi:MAG TPA: bromodomain-containing protein [Allocoleopsis sp.]